MVNDCWSEDGFGIRKSTSKSCLLFGFVKSASETTAQPLFLLTGEAIKKTFLVVTALKQRGLALLQPRRFSLIKVIHF